MSSRLRRTFKDTIAELAHKNLKTLEEKACLASSLAQVFSNHRGVLVDIEVHARRQMMYIAWQLHYLRISKPKPKPADVELVAD